MSRPLHKALPEKTLPNGSGPVMVYMCVCGTKWADSMRSTWECECGRHLVKKNGAICAAVVQTSEPSAVAARIFRTAVG